MSRFTVINGKRRYFGWLQKPAEVEKVVATLPMPIFASAAPDLKDSGAGQVSLLWEPAQKVLGNHIPTRNQGPIGSCVGNSGAWGVDYVIVGDIGSRNEREKWLAPTCAEAAYGLGRFEIGGGQIGIDGPDGKNGGSLGAWQAKAFVEYGTLAYLKYPGHDLSGGYTVARCRAWGNKGLPDDLEPTARQHPIKTTSLIRSYNEARDAIANGYPVMVCSMQGFTSKRDKDGFAKASGQWAHAMLFVGVDDTFGRPGLCCLNPWGDDWISGPTRHDQPPASFWVEAQVCDRMLDDGDSFAYSGFVGYPKRNRFTSRAA